MKKIVRLCSFVLTCIIALSLMSTSCFAAQPPTVSPQWDNISVIKLDISFSGSVGTATGTLTKKSGATSCEGTLTLYKQVGSDWIYVDSAYKSSTRTLMVSIEFDAESGVQYKAVFEGTVYRDGGGESQTLTEYKTCP